MDESDHIQHLVFDNGSRTTKAGFAGEDAPNVVFPSIVGRERQASITDGEKNVYFGDEAQSRSHMLSLKYPIQYGIVWNWVDMEMIWQYTYNELNLDPQDHPVFLTESPRVPKLNREKTTEIMFETFNVPAIYMANPGPLSLYANGSTTGVVVDSGAGMSHIIPVYEGKSLPYATQRLDLAGNELDRHLREMLSKHGYIFGNTENATIRYIKENLSYVASDYDLELRTSITNSDVEKSYELPDGRVIVLGAERFQCPEALFRPPMIELELPGIHNILKSSIVKSNEEIWKDLYGNIVLNGGSTLFVGFAERLHKEISALAPNIMEIKVVDSCKRKYGAWLGGSVLASLDSFKQEWVHKRDYDEYGPTVIHRKCL